MQSNIPFKCPHGEFTCIDVDPNGVLSPECSECEHSKNIDPRKAAIASVNYDLNENIKIGAKLFYRDMTFAGIEDSIIVSFETGAKSQQAKEYWYNRFKQDYFASDQNANDLIDNHRAIGIIGHNPKVILCSSGRIDGKSQLFEAIGKAHKEGIEVVVINSPNYRPPLEVPDFNNEIKEMEIQSNRRPEIFELHNYDMVGECRIVEEPKSYDRKSMPGKMNTYKSKRRNKR